VSRFDDGGCVAQGSHQFVAFRKVTRVDAFLGCDPQRREGADDRFVPQDAYSARRVGTVNGRAEFDFHAIAGPVSIGVPLSVGDTVQGSIRANWISPPRGKFIASPSVVT
jgi:hypothetical protein